MPWSFRPGRFLRGSENVVYVKKKYEQNCRAIFDEKRPSGCKQTDAYTSSLNEKMSQKSKYGLKRRYGFCENAKLILTEVQRCEVSCKKSYMISCKNFLPYYVYTLFSIF